MSRRYEKQLEDMIDGLHLRIVELKNDNIETQYLKDIRYKQLSDKIDKIKILINHQDQFDYKEFLNRLSEIVIGVYK